jgi:hypothetical protein
MEQTITIDADALINTIADAIRMGAASQARAIVTEYLADQDEDDEKACSCSKHGKKCCRKATGGAPVESLKNSDR